MNQEFSHDTSQDCSSIQVDILIEEPWIDRFLTEQQVELPVNDKYTLVNLRINLSPGTLNFKADLKEKEESCVDLTSRPIWNASSQRLQIEDLQLQTSSKNILLKTAGWFARIFLNAKIDRKLEDAANLLYSKQLEKIKKDPVSIPIPKAGNAEVSVSNITIHELIFIEHAIKVKATIDALWKLNLKVEKADP